MSGIRAKLLVCYAVRRMPEMHALGVVFTNGYDLPEAELLATKRWHLGRAQLMLTEWGQLTPREQFEAAAAEREHWTAEALRAAGALPAPGQPLALDSR